MREINLRSYRMESRHFLPFTAYDFIVSVYNKFGLSAIPNTPQYRHTVILTISDDAEADLFRVVDPVDFCLSNFRLTDSNLQGSGVKTMQLTPVFRCVVDGPGPVIIETYSRTNTLCQGRKTDVYGG